VVAAPDGDGRVVVETSRTAYITAGLLLEAHHPAGPRAEVGALPPAPGHVLLGADDCVRLVGADIEGRMTGTREAEIGCTLPEAVGALLPGHRVFFDDGAIGGVVEQVHAPGGAPPTARIRITQAPPGGAKLRAEKGINLPDTDIPVPALTDKDTADLAAVASLADAVALSFVRHPDDVALLQQRLRDLGVGHLGVVLKIETVQGFRRLPAILRTAMHSEHVGVMIARGDLAVEAGYERLAEVQEEILWLCEAAHLPVIWATEVLDKLARTGRPSRSEITDAAMSERAECVMLNKGPHVVDAMLTLHDILQRMAEHQSKKRPLLRPLRSWSTIEHA
jgi:pyruvate kinase